MSPAPFYVQDVARRQPQAPGPMLRIEVAHEYVEDVPALFKAAARAEINQEVAVYSTITGNFLCKGHVEAVLHGTASIRITARIGSGGVQRYRALQAGGRVKR